LSREESEKNRKEKETEHREETVNDVNMKFAGKHRESREGLKNNGDGSKRGGCCWTRGGNSHREFRRTSLRRPQVLAGIEAAALRRE